MEETRRHRYPLVQHRDGQQDRAEERQQAEQTQGRYGQTRACRGSRRGYKAAVKGEETRHHSHPPPSHRQRCEGKAATR
eukprot:5235511-Prymnesium_polylepis.2